MATTLTNRNAKGKFKKGQSGNPAGRPKKKRDPSLQADCKALDKSILAMLGEFIKNPNDQYKPSDRLKAAELVLGYGHGKPRQTVEQVIELKDIDFPTIQLQSEEAELPHDEFNK